MIYELRTYDMRPGSIEEFERRVEEALPHRTHLSPMAAFWHTSHRPVEPGRPHLALRRPERQSGHPRGGRQKPQLAP